MENLKPREAMKAADEKIKQMGGVPEGTRIVQIWDADRRGVTLKFFKSVSDYDKANIHFTENGVTGTLDKKAVKMVNAAKGNAYIISYTTYRLKAAAAAGL